MNDELIQKLRTAGKESFIYGDLMNQAADVVERKHGKWVLVEDFSTEEIEDGEKYWVCSLCGCGSDSYDTTYHTNYCPNCGAKMEES